MCLLPLKLTMLNSQIKNKVKGELHNGKWKSKCATTFVKPQYDDITNKYLNDDLYNDLIKIKRLHMQWC